jgi:hypothetical protein
VRPDPLVAIANDAKYIYGAQGDTLFITAVRSPVFAHHDPMKSQPGARHRHMDQGEQRFTIREQAAPKLSRSDATPGGRRMRCCVRRSSRRTCRAVAIGPGRVSGWAGRPRPAR